MPAASSARVTLALAISIAVLLLGGVVAALTVEHDGVDTAGPSERTGADDASSRGSGHGPATSAADIPNSSSAEDGEAADGSADGGEARGASPDGTTTDGTDGGDGSSSSTAGTVGATASGAGGGSSTTGPAPTGGSPASPPAASPAQPPAAGAYRYRTTAEGEAPEETVVRFDDVVRDGASAVLRRTSQAQGATSVDELDWSPVRVVLRRSTLDFQGTQADCDWQPDGIELDFPLAPGATWAVDVSCSTTVMGFPVTVTRRGTTTVVGYERRPVAGTMLDVWVIEATEDISFQAGPQSGTGTATTRTWFSPEHGLAVRTEATGSGSIAGQTQAGTVTTELLDLAPT